MTFPSSHFQGTHDHEAGPSRITHVNDVALGRTFVTPHQSINNTQSGSTDDMHVDGSLEDVATSNVNMEGRENNASSCHPQSSRHPFRARYNIARNFKNNMVMAKSRLPNPTTCRRCNARLFHHESRDTCCSGGKVSFPRVDAPTEFQELFLDGSAEGKHFRQHIRSYNYVLSFTSIGVHVDESILASGRGIYTFRAQGAFYHNIGSFYPNEGDRPRFLQLYIYDTDNELHYRMRENPQLDESVVQKLQRLLHQYNPFVIRFKQLSLLPNISDCSLILKERPSNHPQYNLPSAEQVAAIIVGGDTESMAYGRDINVIRHDGNLKKVQETKGYYDPLQYPILFPFGTHGWDVNTANCNGRRVSCRAYYSYMLQIRPSDQSMLLNAGRLLQQYIVDNYVKIESGRLRWIREHQSNIRAEVYQGLQDALHVGETNAENIGKRTILPSSFIGGRRDMTQRYEDGMAIVLNSGKPDIFLTMTCNPSWCEITSELLPFQTPQDRPDLLTRIFRAKFEQLKDDVINKGVLGKVKSYMYVTEFQKRGLPHVHMLLVLESNDKLRDPKDYDSVVRTEIPKLECEPQLHEVVVKHMIHGPCGVLNQRSPCMKDGQCKKRYPKQFCDETRQGTDSYPEYRRRFDEPISIGRDRSIDNRWVVPYNPWLLLKYDCHINVEVCSSIKSIKYLYKYVYKGPDRVSMEVHKGSYMDEVQQYVDARWICAPEAIWRIFRFTLYRLYPSVERLQIHLPERHQVRFYEHQRIAYVLNNERNSNTMLTQFFALNQRDPEARSYLYREIPEHYCWNSRGKEWHRRRSTRKVIGRIYTVSPSEGDKFYLRLLLSHVRCPTSWEYLLTNNGIPFNTFKKSAEDRGLLETDHSIRDCLVEVASLRMPYALRRLFVTILIFCEPTDVRSLWNEFFTHMTEDYQAMNNGVELVLTNMLLKDLNELLGQHGKKIEDYDLPSLSPEAMEENLNPGVIQEELAVDIPNEDIESVAKLNNDQMIAFKTIMNVIDQKYSGIFFVDGPGGTGKTFLYRTLMATLRNRGEIVLATASSGIAATLLPGGRTAHSRFKIPIEIQPGSICGIQKQKDLANLIRVAAAIIWDEAPMINKNCLEALNRSLQDVCSNNAPFGGKVMIMGGDFRQVLPVVKKGTKAQMISACIVQSHLWAHTKILRLRQNMRSLHDQEFAEFLIRIGDGVEPTKPDDMVRLPSQIAIPWEGEHSIQVLIQHIFPELELHGWDAPYMVQRAILTPTNDEVQKLNDIIIDQFPGEEHELLSFDEVEGDTHNLYQQEFLNSIAQGSLPPHILKIKKGAPLMLLRNLDPRYGLCNGTRLLCRGLFMNLLDVEILTGSNAGKRAFFRKQFPVRLSFAITINKAQGQTIANVGIYLPRHVFSHGQLYVALSRGVSQTTTKVLIREGKLQGEDGEYTKNVVFKQILLSHPQMGHFEAKWSTWKDEQTISSIDKPDNKVKRLQIYSLGWCSTVITDKTQLWKMVKREILSQRMESKNPCNSSIEKSCCSTKSTLKQNISILQFFKTQDFIDKGVYEELIRLFSRQKDNSSHEEFMFGLPHKERH
ncbi:uncharacterized protein LOC131619101 [Vicia villosa]|uniref:uncharacterized protein LOC131619101 n=1 Tax=Vicia villosa TaxID=3911 RepID=UPI00273A881D|nr:uncharacterized protein LOC131619101 [Vicia villosa]